IRDKLVTGVQTCALPISVSPYIGLDASIKLSDCWRVCAIFQYSVSRTYTTIKGVLKSKGWSQGPSYALLVEYDLTPKFSINVGRSEEHTSELQSLAYLVC